MISSLDLDLNIADRRAQGRLKLVGSKVMAGSNGQKPLLIRNSAGPVTIRAWEPSNNGDRDFENVDLATATVRRALGPNPPDRVPATGTLPLAPLSVPVTSGLLVAGKRYYIKTFVAGDSFTNVGAASNASGVLFTATGATPTTWTNASALQEVTVDLSVEATSAEVQTALNATAAISALGGVTVTKPGAGSYEVLFTNLGARQAMEGPVTWNMDAGSVVSVSRIVPGSATVREIQLIRLLVNPYCYGEFTTPLPAADYTVSTIQGATADLPATKRITLDPAPYDGHFVITLDDNDPFEVPFDASAALIQSLAGERYEVKRKAENAWDISGVDPAQDVTITADVSKLVVPLGVTGDMPLNTVALHRAFAATTARTITLIDQVDITFPGELPRKVYQAEIEIARDALDLSAVVPTPIPASDYATLAGLIAGKEPAHANLAAIRALVTTAYGLGLLTKADGVAILNYISGQPLNANLSAIAALVTAPYGRSLLTAANASVARLLLEAAPLASPNFTGLPTVPTAANPTNNTQAASTAFVHALITELIGASPEALNDINELAAAIGDDPNFAVTVANSVATKLAKASNLSDLTDKLAARANLGVPQINVKQAPYNAVGDGVADDGAAINAANTAATALKARLIFPAGTYLTSEQLSASTSWRGEGAILKAAPGFLFHVIRIADGSSDVTIEGFEIDMSGAAPASQNQAIYVVGSRQTVRNNYVHDTPYTGIGTQNNATHIDISGNVLERIGHVGINSLSDHTNIQRNRIKVTGAAGIGLSGNHSAAEHNITENTTGDGCAGYSMANSHLRVANNTFISPGNHGTHMGGNHLQIVNNMIYNPGQYGIYAASWNDLGDPVTTSTGVTIEGNHIDAQSNAYDGIQVYGYAQAVVTSNFIRDPGQHGINIQTSSGVTVTGNNVNGSVAGNGLRLFLVTDAVLTGNISRNNASHALSISGGSSNITITGNQFSGSVAGNGIQTSGATELYIHGNRLFGNAGGSFSIAASTTNRIGQNYVAETESLASEATLFLPLGRRFITITGTATVTGIAASNWSEQTVTLKFSSSGCTVTDTSTLQLDGDFVSGAASTLTLASDGAKWWEVARSN